MPITEAQKKASIKYKQQNVKRIPLDVPKEKYEEIKQAATTAGETVNGYIKRSIDLRMESETDQGTAQAAPPCPARHVAAVQA